MQALAQPILRARIWMKPFFVLALLCVSGCPAVKWYAQESSHGAFRGFTQGVAELDEQARHRIIAGMLGDKSVDKAARELTAAMTAGAVDAVLEKLDPEKLEKLTSQLARSTLQTLRKEGGAALQELVREGGPMLEASLRRAARDSILSLGSALRETAQEDLGAATRLLVRSATDGMMLSLRLQGRELFREISEGTEPYLRDKVAPGAGEVARTVTREAILGLADGLRDSHVNLEEQLPALRLVMHEIGLGLGEGMATGLGRSVKKSRLEPILIGLSIGLGVLLVAATIAMALFARRYHQASQALQRVRGDRVQASSVTPQTT